MSTNSQGPSRTYRTGLGILLLSLGAVAAAQELPTSSSQVTSAATLRKQQLAECVSTSLFDRDTFLDAYNSGDWQVVQGQLNLLLTAKRTCTLVKTQVDVEFPTRGVSFSVVFINDRLPVPSPTRIVVRSNPPPDLYSTRLVGPDLYDVQLTDDGTVAFKTSYAAVPVTNPILANVAKFAAQITGGLAKAPIFAPLAVDQKMVIQPSSTKYVVTRVFVPEFLQRSTITILDMVDPGEVAIALHRRVKVTNATAGRLRQLLEGLNDALQVVTASQDCLLGTGTVCEKKLGDALAKEVAEVPQKLAGPTDRQAAVAAMSGIMDAYKRVMNAKMPVTSRTTFAPLTKVDLGLGVALILKTSLNQQAKVDSSKNLVDDTPSTLLTYAALNWRPWGYDETTLRPTAREQFRIVAGLALTPSPGVVLGAGWSPQFLRTVSVSAGYGVLLTNVLRRGDALGTSPHDPGHPTRRGALGVLFGGIGYAF